MNSEKINKEKTYIKFYTNAKDYFKNDVARWNFVTMFVMLLFLVIVNITFPLINDNFTYDVWSFLSILSALFGMLNVTTYSIMNLNSDKRNKYRIFIIFNSLAVIFLAAVNFHYHLTILFIENVLFFLSGCYQYYNWFLKYDIQKWKNEDMIQKADSLNLNNDKIVLDGEKGIIKTDDINVTKNEEKFHFYKYSTTDNLYFIIAILLITTFVFAQLAFPQLTGYDEGFNWYSDTAKVYELPRMIIDSFLGVGGMLGAFLVAKRKYSAIYIYLINDLALIAFWLWIGIHGANNDSINDLFTALNLIPLFFFYLMSNVFNGIKWRKTLI